jgi:hypothetical protein
MIFYLYVVYNLLHALWNYKEPFHSCLHKIKEIISIFMFITIITDYQIIVHEVSAYW